MLALAMKPTRRARNRGFMEKAVPGIVYDHAHENYDTMPLAALRTRGVKPPATLWPKWRIESIEFRLRSVRDRGELMASCKWPIDFLVKQRFVKNDSPRELLPRRQQRSGSIARTAASRWSSTAYEPRHQPLPALPDESPKPASVPAARGGRERPATTRAGRPPRSIAVTQGGRCQGFRHAVVRSVEVRRAGPRRDALAEDARC
jgi:hypothetical protein